MADKFSGSAVGGGRNVNVGPKAGKQGMADKARPTIKGGKNLLPSKMVVGMQRSAGVSSTSKHTQGPLKPPSQSSSLVDADRLDTAYELYLQALLTDILVTETQELQDMVHADTCAMKCVEATGMDRIVSRIYADNMVLHSFVNLLLMSKIANSLEDLVDFTGDETLVEIQSILSRKYDKIMLEGGTLSRPIFKDMDIEEITRKLKQSLAEVRDERNVLGFSSLFYEALKNLKQEAEIIARKNVELHAGNKILLENCSLIACNTAQSASARQRYQDRLTKSNLKKGE